ncbi:MAG: protein kinase domain-containing protein [Planctomycetaceae bacterium]
MPLGNPCVETILAEAVEFSAPHEREAYLDRACAGDDALRARVERLIDLHFQAGSFLDSRPLFDESTPAPETAVESVGTQIGPYRLLEQIGEGGMGVVYVAEQERPVRRKVALKVIKPGMDTREVIARFEAERQALALMDHPHIAKVLDAGTTDEGDRDWGLGTRGQQAGRSPSLTPNPQPLTPIRGRPYFVMELFRGVPITDYCDRNQLPIRERLELFIKVCQAIQHAHQRGIIHRDIKPSNVLVALQDGAVVPKVIDFGIAKAMNQRLTEQTLYTRQAQMVGTPLYMSPEQAELSGLDVDTRSDVYSLGVLLYELLTGMTPFDSATFQRVGYDELRRIIREEEPPRPSQRVSTLAAEKLSTVSRQRGFEARRLPSLLKGELDWIAMRALEKDRSRRYESAGALAADVERYLTDQPVAACPPSAVYRLRKFARRRKGLLTAAALLCLTVVAGSAVSVWQAVEATAARDESDRHASAAKLASKLANERLESETEAREEAQRERQKAEASLKQAVAAVDTMLTRASDEKLSHIPGTDSVRKQLLEDALTFYEGFVSQQGDDPALRFEVAKAWGRVAQIQSRVGQFNQAFGAYASAVRVTEELLNEQPDNFEYMELFAEACQGLGSNRWKAGRGPAKADFNRSLAASRRLQAMFPNELKYRLNVLDKLHDLSILANVSGGHAEALEHAQEVVAGLREVQADLPAGHKGLGFMVWALRTLGELVVSNDFEAGDKLLAEAESLAVALIAANTDTVEGKATIDVNYALPCVVISRAQSRSGRGKDAERESLLRRAIALLESYLAGRPDLAIPRGHLAQTNVQLAGILIDGGRDDEAELALRSAWDHTRQCAGGGFTRGSLKAILDSYVPVLTRLGRADQIAPLYREYVASLEQELAEPDREAGRVADSQNQLAWVLATAAQPESRDPERAVELASQAVANSHSLNAAERWNTLGVARYRNGDWTAALEALQKSGLSRRGSGSNWFFLAMTHWQLGHNDEARTWFGKAVDWTEKKAPVDDELRRFRAEAADLPGITEDTGQLTRPVPGARPD